MGFCSSPCFANFASESLENKILKGSLDRIGLYRRYVDNCLLIVEKDRVDEVLNHFNNMNSNLGHVLCLRYIAQKATP